LPKYGERSIQYGFGDLESGGYGNRKPGANTSGYADYLPPLWTFYTVLHPVITIEFSTTDIAVVNCETGEIMTTSHALPPRAVVRASAFWAELNDSVAGMTTAELGEKRYNAIEMQRRDPAHAKFWRVQERMYAGELADRGILQPAVILRRLRHHPR
jgi:hypothetical protein